MNRESASCLIASLLLAAWLGCPEARAADLEKTVTGGLYQKWRHGPWSEPGFFPIAVWLQSPAKAEQYRKAGFNTYVALWRGPTDEQLATLKKADMKVICHQNETALRHLEDPSPCQRIPGLICSCVPYFQPGLAKNASALRLR